MIAYGSVFVLVQHRWFPTHAFSWLRTAPVNLNKRSRSALIVAAGSQRDRHRSSCSLSSLLGGHPETPNQTFCPKRVLQNVWRVHWGDNVRRSLFCPMRCSQERQNSPARLIDAGIPYIILGIRSCLSGCERADILHNRPL